jgi:hypothetical protein
MPRGHAKNAAGDTETARRPSRRRATGTEPILDLKRSYSSLPTSCAKT